MIKDDDGLIDFISGFLGKSESYGESDLVIRTNWRIHLDSIGEFVDLKEVEVRIRNIFSSLYYEKLEDRRKLAIKTFLDTIDGKIKNRF